MSILSASQLVLPAPCLGLSTVARPFLRLKTTPDPVRCRSKQRRLALNTRAQAPSLGPGSTVLVAGATGGVGQLVTAKLIERGYKVKAVTRSPAKAEQLFGSASDKLQFVDADFRSPETLIGLMEGVDAVCCATGTTAFPSSRWEGNNGPRPTDLEGTTNLVNAAPKSLKRFILITSAGVERQQQFPWLILNLFGVLKFKAMSEQALIASGLPWTILRPGRLTDGPYTSFDLNTLLKATAGSRQAVQLSPRDDLLGEASRIAVAEAVLQCLVCPETVNSAMAISSTEGDGPGSDTTKWSSLFKQCLGAASKVPSTAA